MDYKMARFTNSQKSAFAQNWQHLRTDRKKLYEKCKKKLFDLS